MAGKDIDHSNLYNMIDGIVQNTTNETTPKKRGRKPKASTTVSTTEIKKAGEQLGESLGDGVAEGVEKKATKVKKATEKVIEQAKEQIENVELDLNVKTKLKLESDINSIKQDMKKVADSVNKEMKKAFKDVTWTEEVGQQINELTKKLKVNQSLVKKFGSPKDGEEKAFQDKVILETTQAYNKLKKIFDANNVEILPMEEMAKLKEIKDFDLNGLSNAGVTLKDLGDKIDKVAVKTTDLLGNLEMMEQSLKRVSNTKVDLNTDNLLEEIKSVHNAIEGLQTGLQPVVDTLTKVPKEGSKTFTFVKSAKETLSTLQTLNTTLETISQNIISIADSLGAEVHYNLDKINSDINELQGNINIKDDSIKSAKTEIAEIMELFNSEEGSNQLENLYVALDKIADGTLKKLKPELQDTLKLVEKYYELGGEEGAEFRVFKNAQRGIKKDTYLDDLLMLAKGTKTLNNQSLIDAQGQIKVEEGIIQAKQRELEEDKKSLALLQEQKELAEAQIQSEQKKMELLQKQATLFDPVVEALHEMVDLLREINGLKVEVLPVEEVEEVAETVTEVLDKVEKIEEVQKHSPTVKEEVTDDSLYSGHTNSKHSYDELIEKASRYYEIRKKTDELLRNDPTDSFFAVYDKYDVMWTEEEESIKNATKTLKDFYKIRNTEDFASHSYDAAVLLDSLAGAGHPFGKLTKAQKEFYQNNELIIQQAEVIRGQFDQQTEDNNIINEYSVELKELERIFYSLEGINLSDGLTVKLNDLFASLRLGEATVDDFVRGIYEIVGATDLLNNRQDTTPIVPEIPTEEVKEEVNVVSQAYDKLIGEEEELAKKLEEHKDRLKELAVQIREVQLSKAQSNLNLVYESEDMFDKDSEEEFINKLNRVAKSIPKSQKKITEYVKEILKGGDKSEQTKELLEVMRYLEYAEFDSVDVHGLKDVITKTNKEKLLNLGKVSKGIVEELKTEAKRINELKDEIQKTIQQVSTDIDNKNELQDINYNDNKLIGEKNYLEWFQRYFSNRFKIPNYSLINVEDITNAEQLKQKIEQLTQKADEFREIESDNYLVSENSEEEYQKWLESYRAMMQCEDELSAYRNVLYEVNMLEKENANIVTSSPIPELQAEEQAVEEVTEAYKELDAVKDQTKTESATPTDPSLEIPISMGAEASKMADLENAVNEVTGAINTKTQAFEKEGNVVTEVVNKEILDLKGLHSQLMGIYQDLLDLDGKIKQIAETKIEIGGRNFLIDNDSFKDLQTRLENKIKSFSDINLNGFQFSIGDAETINNLTATIQELVKGIQVNIETTPLVDIQKWTEDIKKAIDTLPITEVKVKADVTNLEKKVKEKSKGKSSTKVASSDIDDIFDRLLRGDDESVYLDDLEVLEQTKKIYEELALSREKYSVSVTSTGKVTITELQKEQDQIISTTKHYDDYLQAIDSFQKGLADSSSTTVTSNTSVKNYDLKAFKSQYSSIINQSAQLSEEYDNLAESFKTVFSVEDMQEWGNEYNQFVSKVTSIADLNKGVKDAESFKSLKDTNISSIDAVIEKLERQGNLTQEAKQHFEDLKSVVNSTTTLSQLEQEQETINNTKARYEELSKIQVNVNKFNPDEQGKIPEYKNKVVELQQEYQRLEAVMLGTAKANDPLFKDGVKDVATYRENIKQIQSELKKSSYNTPQPIVYLDDAEVLKQTTELYEKLQLQKDKYTVSIKSNGEVTISQLKEENNQVITLTKSYKNYTEALSKFEKGESDKSTVKVTGKKQKEKKTVNTTSPDLKNLQQQYSAIIKKNSDLSDEVNRLAESFKNVTDVDGLKVWNDELDTLRKNLAQAKKDADDESARTTLDGSKNAQVRTVENTINKLKRLGLLTEEAENRFKALIGTIKNIDTKDKLDAQLTSITNLRNVYEDLSKIESKVKTFEPDTEGKVPAYATRVRELQDEFKRLEKVMLGTNKADDPLFKDGTKGVAEYKASISSLIKELGKVTYNLGSNKFGDFDEAFAESSKEIEEYVRQVSKAQGKIMSFKEKNLSDGIRQFTVDVKTSNNTIKTLSYSYDSFANTVYKDTIKINQSMSGLQAGFDKFKKKLKDVVKYYASFVSIQNAISKFREGVNIVKDLNTQFTEMRKVSNESIESLKTYQKEAHNIAKSIGATTSEILSSTADWMRLGFSLQEAAESAKATNILMNVSEFGNINEATDALVAMKSAYRELGDMEIVDKLNLVGKHYCRH